MEAVLVVLGVIILVAGYFMVRAFVRLAGAMHQMKDSLTELGQMAPRLQQLTDEMAVINEVMEKRSRQSGPPA